MRLFFMKEIVYLITEQRENETLAQIKEAIRYENQDKARHQ